MAARRKQKKLDQSDVEINMTPMIDVVFNLIIFFMVITDMTQKDLEYLVLPRAEQAQEDPGDDPERLIINIVDLSSEVNAERVKRGELSASQPPVFVDGKQVKSLDDMRAWLRFRADPLRFPELEKPEVAPGIRPSRKPLLVRCDHAQVFGWVQAVMQFCTFVPGRNQVEELKKSPLIYKLEIAVAEREAGK